MGAGAKADAGKLACMLSVLQGLDSRYILKKQQMRFPDVLDVGY